LFRFLCCNAVAVRLGFLEPAKQFAGNSLAGKIVSGVTYNVSSKTLNLSPPIVLKLYNLPYWSSPPFLIFDIRALRTECQNVKIKNDWLDQYGAEPFKQQQFGTAGVEGVKPCYNKHVNYVTTYEPCYCVFQ